MWKTASPDWYPNLRDNARDMRRNPTVAENILWNVIRNQKLGVKFRRQHIIGDFIVDFVNLDSGLVIELDGGYHDQPQQQIDDLNRTESLNKSGFKVIRFTNDEVLNDIDSVITSILSHLKTLSPNLPPRR